jgi:hypothetical protein
MQADVKSDMEASARIFQSMVWPLCRKHFGGGELLQMEGRPDIELARLLDMRAGIDGWHIHSGGMRGIASRVQYGHDWRTFTVRMSRDSGAKTEYQKRFEAIHTARGWIYPAITVHAYAETQIGPIISIGIARTADVIDFIAKGLHKERRTSNAVFAACSWLEMRKTGYRVEVIEALHV